MLGKKRKGGSEYDSDLICPIPKKIAKHFFELPCVQSPPMDDCSICWRSTPRSMIVQPMAECQHADKICIQCVLTLQYTAISEHVVNETSSSFMSHQAKYKCPFCRAICPVKTDLDDWMDHVDKLKKEPLWPSSFSYSCLQCGDTQHSSIEAFRHAIYCPKRTLRCPCSCDLELPPLRTIDMIKEAYQTHVTKCYKQAIKRLLTTYESVVLPIINKAKEANWSSETALRYRKTCSIRKIEQIEQRLVDAMTFFRTSFGNVLTPT